MYMRNIIILMFLALWGGMAYAQDSDTVEITYLPERTYHPALAIKTNVLYDLYATPNIELERWLDRKMEYSIMGEVQFPWYTWHHNERSYEVFNAGLEVRWWFARNHKKPEAAWRPLVGHFFGLYFMAGYYDIGWDNKGHQGEYGSAGLTYGYACRLSPRFNIEFSLSGGVVGGPYRRYHGISELDNKAIEIEKRGHWLYWGPTKAKISLVWLIGNHHKKGGNR